MAAEVRRLILEHPERHDQSSWFDRTECGTTACVAGWTYLLTGGDPTVLGDPTGILGVGHVLRQAKAALGLPHIDGAVWLFAASRTRDEVLDALARIAAADGPGHVA